MSEFKNTNTQREKETLGGEEEREVVRTSKENIWSVVDGEECERPPPPELATTTRCAFSGRLIHEPHATDPPFFDPPPSSSIDTHGERKNDSVFAVLQ